METREILLSLLRAVIKGENKPSIPADCDEAGLFALAQSHGVAAAIAGFFPENTRFHEEKLKAIARDIEQERAVCELFDALDGTPAIPLKGLEVKALWPYSYMRTMGDIDLLINEADAPKIIEIMRSQGFSLQNESSAQVLVMHRPPILNFELHTVMITEPAAIAKVFDDGGALKVNGGLPAHVQYAYLLAHIAKHFSGAGCGLRPIIDVYLYRKNVPFDRKLSNELLEAAKIAEFAGNIEALGECIFEGAEKTPLLAELLDFIFGTALYGDTEKRDIGKRRKKSVLGNIWAHTFLPYRDMVRIYPRLKRCKIALPFYWILRIFAVLLGRQGNFTAYKRSIERIDEKKAAELRLKLNSFGLNL